MLDELIDHFRTGARDLRGRIIGWPARTWVAAGKAASIEDRERTERRDAKRQKLQKARDALRMERHVKKYGSWFPSDGPP